MFCHHKTVCDSNNDVSIKVNRDRELNVKCGELDYIFDITCGVCTWKGNSHDFLYFSMKLQLSVNANSYYSKFGILMSN